MGPQSQLSCFQCHVFIDDAWSSGPCETTELSVSPDNTLSAHCECSVPGYIAVFLTQDSKPLLQMQSTPALNKTIVFT